MIPKTFTRRRLLAGAALLPFCGAALPVGRVMADTVCANPNLGDPEQRKSLHYVEASADPRKSCDGCMYFQTQGRCGSCRILAGQVNPDGSCDSWSAKP